jgi:hypothetical protein
VREFPKTRNRTNLTLPKEVIGGYAILEADSLKEAIAPTERFLRIHGPEWDLE